MKPLLLSLVIVFFTIQMAIAQTPDYPEFETFTMTRAAQGTTTKPDTLPYRLLKPVDYDPAKKHPLVVFFHGAGERGTDNKLPLTHIAPLFLKPENRNNFPCFVLVPQCPKNVKWVDTDWKLEQHTQPEKISVPMEMAMQLIENLQKEYAIDAKRIYATGLSMGGFATWDIVARFPKKFACAVPVCGGADEKTAKKIKDLPIWAFHGALDKVVLPSRSRNMVKALQEAGGKPKYTEYSDVHHDSWKRAYATPDLLKWMFEQKRIK
ncbi:MAG: prolyl oligopeptidase family serine peptidase [Microscillaceae bacterium]|jgi:predicted peptidase|nr:prolyl oligopeptidase family serine peptidase [Microscillaceae bacterium]